MQLNDGYTDLPPGKIANVVTCLEMLSPPAPRPDPPGITCALARVRRPDPKRYRTLFRRVGDPYLWFSRLMLTDEQLVAATCDPGVEVYAVRCGGADEGLLELDFRTAGECELRYFGLTQRLIGTGAGRWLMNRTLDTVWSRPIRRLWVHTCTLDHPEAVSFYMRSGFVPFKRQIEYCDDPRLTGILPRETALHIPLV